MGSDKAALIVRIMLGYGIEVAKWIDQDIRDKVTSTDTMLAFFA